MNPLFSRLISTVRKIRFSLSPKTRLLTFGAIYLGTYTNYKNDRTPLIWIQWSGERYTHGINLHYLSFSDKAWFFRTIYLISKGNQNLTPKNMYLFIKMRRPEIIKKAYRKYFTSLLNMRLVSPGITNLHKLVYTDHKEKDILALNKTLEPSEMKLGALKIAYSTEELQERVIQATQAGSITSKRVAPYIKETPITNKAPWVKE